MKKPNIQQNNTREKLYSWRKYRQLKIIFQRHFTLCKCSKSNSHKKNNFQKNHKGRLCLDCSSLWNNSELGTEL